MGHREVIVFGPATVETFEIVLRVLALIVVLAAASLMWWGLIVHRIRPRPIWLYTATVTTIGVLWRIVVLLFAFDAPLHDAVQVWITPLSAVVTGLIGVCLLLLAFCATRRRRTDE